MRLPIAHRSTVFFLAAFLVIAFGGASRAADQTPSAPETPEATGSLRPRPTPRPFHNPAANAPTDAVRSDRTPTASPADTAARTDDPVLRWLPEILAASAATGTPPALIAGVMRVESGGDPESVSVDGAQGLMQVMPAELAALGIPRGRWRDPRINVLAGATILAQRSGGGWEAAVASYFGIGCDAYGTCTYDYVVAVLNWTVAYAAVLDDSIVVDTGNIPDVPDRIGPAPGQTTTDTGQGWDGEERPTEPANPPAHESPAESADETPPPRPTADANGWSVDGEE
jgi:hypothetical protein